MPYVPVIDLDRDPAVVAAELNDVCTTIGFFQITGHGVPDAVADRAWNAAAAFFDLPLPEKLRAAIPEPGYPFGYSPLSGESLSRSLGDAAPPDLKEVFNAGPVDPPTHRFADPDEASAYARTPWPEALPELRLAWTDYYRVMLGLSGRIMSLFARGLGLPAGFFDDTTDHCPSSMRAINYPAQDRPPLPGQVRAGAHTDYGILTVLRQDAVGGLQVQDQSGRWADVTPIPGAFVINIGDLMARWTNDRWRSTMHRVVNPPTDGQTSRHRRQSMPFFHNANWDAQVTCLPTCLAPGERPTYPPVTAGPHLMAKFRRTVTA